MFINKNLKINSIEILQYNAAYATYFHDLNIEWLQTYFYVEAYDKEVLSNPEAYIISKGGHIFFAKTENGIVGTVALMPTNNDGIFELTKMTVAPSERGKKVGQYLLYYCINYAKETLQVPMLILYSNTKLENAIYIYRKFGFIQVPMETNSPYRRSDIKMELSFK